MFQDEFIKLLKTYQSKKSMVPTDGSKLMIEIANRVIYLTEMMELMWPEAVRDELNLEEKPLIDDPNCICPYQDKKEAFVISYKVKDIFDIFHHGFWSYVCESDPEFVLYCATRSKYSPGSKKTYTYIQPKRALHYLLAKGTPVTKNKIKRYFKIVCKNNAPQEFVVPA